MPTVSRFVIWERPPDFRKTPPKLASVLGEVGIESLDRVHGREPSFLGRDVSEIERLLVSSNLGMLAHAWWPPGEATPDCMLDQSVEVLELNARSNNCLSNAGIRTIRSPAAKRVRSPAHQEPGPQILARDPREARHLPMRRRPASSRNPYRTGLVPSCGSAFL